MSVADDRFAGMTEELIPGKLRGYRQWVIPAFEPRLRSMGQPEMDWPTAVLEAECVHKLSQRPQQRLTGPHMFRYIPRDLIHDGPAPDPKCTCGIYGWYRPEDTSWTVSGPDWPIINVLGVVEVQGKVLMGKRGFRAQHARILAICIPSHDSQYELAALGGWYAQPPWAFANWNYRLNPDGTYTLVSEEGTKPKPVPKYGDVVEQIRARYQLPLFRSLDKLCEEFPPDDVSELVPGLPPSRFDPRVAERRKREEAERRLGLLSTYATTGRMPADLAKFLYGGLY